MHRLIKELRRREVFRTVGLYIGIFWIVIEAASVFLPAFDAPDWVLRGVIIVAVMGLPVTVVLAWIYDVSDSGIEVQGGPTDTVVVPFGGRKTDFTVIGVLVIALGISVYLNVTGSRSAVVEAIEPISVLIADFDNQTGDALFDGTLEQALNIGLEGATFITAYRRTSAETLLESLRPGSVLDEAGARLVSLREGVKLVVAGSVAPDGDGYELTARIVNPEDGVVIAGSSVGAKSKLEVLTAISTLADDIREELGDKSVSAKDRPLGETFTAASLEAVKNYTEAQKLASSFKFEEAVAFYQAAVLGDPNFGRAYSGWALALFNLGKEDEANERWNQALSKMDTMTERERYRTLGLYYVAVTGDFQKGIESYQSLVDKFPADNMGYNNLAVAYFMTLDF
jgi:hypothetical protein